MLLWSQPMCACVCVRTSVCTWMRGTWFNYLQNFVVWTLDKFFKDYMVLLLMVHETCVMMWCARSIDAVVITVMLKCYTKVPLHHLDHFGTCVWVCKVGWTTGVCQILSVAPTLFEPLAPVKYCCKLQTIITVHVLHSRMNDCWSCTFRTQKPDDAVFRVPGWIHNYTPLSNTLLCRGHTEQPVYDVWL